MVIREGGVIAEGFDAELDELRAISTNAGDYLVRLEQQEKPAPGSPPKSRLQPGAGLLY